MSTIPEAEDPRSQQPQAPVPPPAQAPAPPTAEPQLAAPPTADPTPPAGKRTGPRTGPIVWGALILAFCGYTAQRAFGGAGIDTAWWITATVIGLGVLLLAVGAAVVIRNRR